MLKTYSFLHVNGCVCIYIFLDVYISLCQVSQGVSEFRPTPSENRDCFKNSYNVKHTLLVCLLPYILELVLERWLAFVRCFWCCLSVSLKVKFNFDTIDETDILEETLKPRVESFGGTVEKVQLSGNHITPCIQVKHPCILHYPMLMLITIKSFLFGRICFFELSWQWLFSHANCIIWNIWCMLCKLIELTLQSWYG